MHDGMPLRWLAIAGLTKALIDLPLWALYDWPLLHVGEQQWAYAALSEPYDIMVCKYIRQALQAYGELKKSPNHLRQIAIVERGRHHFP